MDGTPLTRIYIWAKPRFSHREMFAKQEKFLDKIIDLDCPLNGAFQLAITRDLTISSICCAKVNNFNKIEKELTLSFVHGIEIVAFDPVNTGSLIQWLSNLWKGSWKEIKTKKAV